MAKDLNPEITGPGHVAIIMDGNGRWAQQRNRPRLFGHHAGAKRVREIVNANYGGRDQVTRAAKKIAYEIEQGRLTHKDVDAETLAKFLDTQFLPDPDLVIRTSGEARISNFLLWQSAYAEYEFLDTLWPDFTAAEFAQVVGNYGNRERRFGAVLA